MELDSANATLDAVVQVMVGVGILNHIATYHRVSKLIPYSNVWTLASQSQLMGNAEHKMELLVEIIGVVQSLVYISNRLVWY